MDNFGSFSNTSRYFTSFLVMFLKWGMYWPILALGRVLRYCCKNGERVKKIHTNAERCIADNARIPSNAFHPMQCEAGGRVLHWMQCITRDVCNISNTPRGMNVYFLYSRAILAAKTLLLKIGMNKRKKSWCNGVPHFHFTIFFEKVMHWIHYIDFSKKVMHWIHYIAFCEWDGHVTSQKWM